MNKKQSLEVHLDDRSYPIHIGYNLGSDISTTVANFLNEGRKGAVLIDEKLAQAQPNFSQEITHSIPQLVIPSGEGSKSVHQLSVAWDFLASAKIDRSGFLLAVGGGVVGDLAGFAAASFLRGISFYQIPTTLLAMVDSSVGGKTGINLDAGKNLVGSFHQPSCVWADLALLETLPEREFSAGMSEVIKYGMLADQALFQSLQDRETPIRPGDANLADMVERCCSIKARVVQDDEKESNEGKGGRALLNLGHTFGHAIEKVAGFGIYLHGEAVAIGLVCALRLSQHLGMCQSISENQLLSLLQSYHLPSSLKEPLPVKDLKIAMGSDKKVDRGKLRFVVMEEIGSAYCSTDPTEEQINQVWKSVGAT